MHNETNKKENLSIIGKDTPFSVTEAFKSLRTNLQYTCPDKGCHVICVTSSIAHEGKTSTALNLSKTIADSGKKVLLIDADMRASNIARSIGLCHRKGLSDLLVEGISALSVEETTADFEGIDLILSGRKVPSPSEMLGSNSFAELISYSREKYDYIIIDTPPAGLVSDALCIASLVDGYAVVVKADYTKKGMLHDTLKALETVKGRVLGIILVGVRQKSSKYGRYGKYGKYGGYGEYGT